MPTPQKGYKALNHNDVLYRWILQNKRGVNEMVVVASAPVNGQKLVVELPRVVNPQMVPKAIDFALERGSRRGLDVHRLRMRAAPWAFRDWPGLKSAGFIAKSGAFGFNGTQRELFSKKPGCGVSPLCIPSAIHLR